MSQSNIFGGGTVRIHLCVCVICKYVCMNTLKHKFEYKSLMGHTQRG